MTMTDTEAKALALTNEVRRDKGRVPYGAAHWPNREESESLEALCRAIEREAATEARHAAEMRELKERFSEAAKAVLHQMRANQLLQASLQPILAPFILPAPDPLVEAVGDALEGQGMGRPSHTTTEITARLRAAIEARGGKIVWEAGE